MISELLPGLRATLVLALLTGLLFPLLITSISALIFPKQAAGSLVKNAAGTVIGSELLAQNFASPKYFHARPSSAGSGYAGEASSASNLGPTSAKLFEGVEDDPKTKADETFLGVKQLAAAFRKENGLTDTDMVPIDAITRSGSGLDPDISEQNAQLQAGRVAKARNISIETVRKLLKTVRTDRDLGILGEPRLNVLNLNIALDAQTKQ